MRGQLASINAELDERVQELDEANELLEYWVEFSPAVLYSYSFDAGELRPSYISKNFHRLLGFERTEAVIDPEFWRNRIHPDDCPAFLETIGGLLQSELPHAVFEYRVQHKAGNYVTVLDSVRAVHDAEGTTIELVGAWTDISARLNN